MKKLLFFVFLTIFGLQMTQAQSEDLNGNPGTENATTKKIKIFPNPATNVVNVLGLKNCAKADISISDVYGNMVLQHRWEIRRQALSIPIPNLEAGIYVIRISSEEQKVQAKFYKQ